MQNMKLIIDLSKTKYWSGKSEIVNKAIAQTFQIAILHKPLLITKVCLVSVRMTDNQEIQKINRDFRGKNTPTNVLSFQTVDWNQNSGDEIPIELLHTTRNTVVYEISENTYQRIKINDISGGIMILNIGDIVLSHNQILDEANEQGKDFNEYLQFITAHGILHLLGYDHEFEEDAEKMSQIERAIMETYGQK
jgi:probable rRNA maturation factor